MYRVEVVVGGRGSRETLSYSAHPLSLQLGPNTIREDQFCLQLSGNQTGSLLASKRIDLCRVRQENNIGPNGVS